jgi:hypothetical protein
MTSKLTTTERRAQPELLSRTLVREARILMREPRVLALATLQRSRNVAAVTRPSWIGQELRLARQRS